MTMPRDHWWRRNGGASLGPQRAPARALALLLLVALPVSCGIGVLAARRGWLEYRAEFQTHLADSAHAASLAIDSRLRLYRTAAQVLALSPSLRDGADPAGLLPEANAVAASLGGMIGISRADGQGAPLFAAGAPAPAASPAPDALPHSLNPAVVAAHARLRASGEPVLTDLFTSHSTGRQMLMISALVPPPAHGPQLVLDYLFDPAELSATLAGQQLAAGAYSAIADGDLRVIARSRDAASFVGRPVPGWARAMNPAAAPPDGVMLDGRQALLAYAPIRLAPRWRLVVVAPLEDVSAILTGPLLNLLLACGAVPAVLLAALVLSLLRTRDDHAAYAELDRILTVVPATIFVDRMAPDGRRTRIFLSRTAGAICGATWEELRADSSRFIQTLDPPSREIFAEFRREVRSEGRGVTEVRITHADGKPRIVRYAEVCFERGRDGSMLIAGCVTDITAETNTRARLRQMEKLAVLGEVASGIAHEMNQPLSAIAMAAENGANALSHPRLDLGRARTKFAVIRSQAHRIATVIDHIRVFGRAERDASTPIDIDRIIEDSLTLLEGRIRQEELLVERHIAADLPVVLAVPVMLEQVLLNILANAMDAYNGREAAERWLRIAVAPAETTAPLHPAMCITVADRAGGIPPQVMDRIFDPFFTTKPPGEGTGLGLSISFATIAEMGGRIEVANADGGAVFTILLPAAPAEPPAANHQPAARRRLRRGGGAGGAKLPDRASVSI